MRTLRRNDASRTVIIVVPTIVLKSQWEKQLNELNLSENTEVYVINTLVKRNAIDCKLLILDEICPTKTYLTDGNPLKLITPSIRSNTECGWTNYPGMVKEYKIGQSAAKYPFDGEGDKSSTTIQKWSRALKLEKVGFCSTSMYI